jgi:antitoxin component YwqK of YwqJK toxin-antitoxin module
MFDEDGSGTIVEYHPNGEMKSHQSFYCGTPHGDWNQWDEMGIEVGSIRYEYGVLVG